MSAKINHSTAHPRNGFSLVEMLVVIAVIGIISAIALPAISNSREASKEAAAKRNAQSLASLSAAATAAGIYHVLPDSIANGGVQGTIDLLTIGLECDMGMIFIYNISPEAAAEAEAYLAVEFKGDQFTLEYTGS